MPCLKFQQSSFLVDVLSQSQVSSLQQGMPSRHSKGVSFSKNCTLPTNMLFLLQMFLVTLSISSVNVAAFSSGNPIGSTLEENDMFETPKDSSNFRKAVGEMVKNINSEINKANKTLTLWEEEVRNVEHDLADTLDELEEIDFAATEKLSELEVDCYDELKVLDLKRQALANTVERLEGTVTINRNFLNKQMRVNKQKYAKKRLQIKSLVADFTDAIGAMKRLANPFESPGATMDLIDCGIRLTMNIVELGINIAEDVKQIG